MFLSPLFSVLSCRFSSLSVGWVCLAVLVGFVLGVVGVHGERGVRGGSGGVGALVVL